MDDYCRCAVNATHVAQAFTVERILGILRIGLGDDSIIVRGHALYAPR